MVQTKSCHNKAAMSYVVADASVVIVAVRAKQNYNGEVCLVSQSRLLPFMQLKTNAHSHVYLQSVTNKIMTFYCGALLTSSSTS